jgi:Replication-relaxation
MNAKLTTRDIAIILDVYNYRYLSVSQIRALHFPSKLTAWRRLQALTELGVIKAFTVPTIPERLFYLDKKGAEIVAIELQREMEDLDWHRHTKQPKDYYFLKHFMAINDFRMTLTQACQKSSLTLLGFLPEYIGEQTKEGYVKKYIRDRVNEYSHTPDAVFALEKDGKPALFFLEIDRGIEIVSDPEKGFLKCVVFYLNYWISQRWQRYTADFTREFPTFRTLIITTSKDRLEHMREAVTRLPFREGQAKRFLWGTIQSQATAEWLFESMWRSMDTGDSNLYRIG